MPSSEPSPASSFIDRPEPKREPDSEHAAEAGGAAQANMESADPASKAREHAAREGGEKAKELELGSRDRAGAAGNRRSNSRGAAQAGKVMALTLLAYMLVLALAGAWFHRRLMSEIDARLASGSSTVERPTAGTDVGPASAERKHIEALRDSDSKKIEAALGALSKRIGEVEARNEKQSARVEELASALTEARAALKEKRNAPVLPAGETLPPAQGELVLLKERNRLTSYADEAIATGARAPYERLWEALGDPRISSLAHAARAEILRVQNYYLGGSRIDRYDIPVGTYFPEQAALKDSQLKDDQLMQLLRDKKNPWEVRMKAANLLGMRRSVETGDALVAAVKSDENLDVVKEATFSFEHMTGFRARIFDADSLEQWWKQYKATPTPPKPKAKADNSKAPKPEPKESSASAVPNSPNQNTEKK